MDWSRFAPNRILLDPSTYLFALDRYVAKSGCNLFETATYVANATGNLLDAHAYRLDFAEDRFDTARLVLRTTDGLARTFCRCRMFAVKLLGFYFREKMEGTVQRAGERFDRPFRFDFDVHAPSVLGFATTAVGECTGTVRIDGLAKDVPATGHLELSPVARKTIRYVFDFTADDGKKYRFDGSKRTTWRRHLVGWTTLPGKVYDADGNVWGDALLRFSLARDLRKLLGSIKVGPRAALAGAHA